MLSTLLLPCAPSPTPGLPRLSRRRAPLATSSAHGAATSDTGNGSPGSHGASSTSLGDSFWRDSPPTKPSPPPVALPASEFALVGEQFWRQGGGFPRYLQAVKARRQRSRPAVTSQQSPHAPPDVRSDDANSADPMWAVIRREAQTDADSEPVLSSFLYGTILAQPSFDKALAFVLANRLASAQLLSTQLMELFGEVLESHADVRLAARCDVAATRARDPSCRTHADCLLYFKGYHALQAYRLAHALWGRGQTLLALALQSRVSEVFAVDIHPAARIGRGILLDHGTGVVIGETASVGDGCSILQGVTLGGTGKEAGDRHPKIGAGVLIGAHACVLGNIGVGEGAMIAAGALVLKPVGAHTMVAGSPARVVGTTADAFPAQSMSQTLTPKLSSPL